MSSLVLIGLGLLDRIKRFIRYVYHQCLIEWMDVWLIGFVQKFEFTPEGIAKRAVATVNFYKDVKPLRSPLNRAFTQLI